MEHRPLEELSYRKSNELVSAKYKSTLLENQLIAIALTRIEVNARDKESPLRARLYPGELKRLIGDPTHIYSRLKQVSKSMTGHSVVIEDGNGNFHAMALVTNADYVDGVLEIRINNELRNHILGLEKRYTTLELSVMTGFKKDSSFRLYEILKSQIYKLNHSDHINLEYNISELRFMIGLANADDIKIKNERNRMGKDIDWDVLYEKLDKKDKMYVRWSEFERNILRPAKAELEEKSDIRFTYKGLREGRQIKRILFSVYPNTPEILQEVNEKEAYLKKSAMKNRQQELPRDLPEFVPLYDAYVGHNDLSPEDIDHLIKVSNMNKSLVEQAILAADEVGNIQNYMGWMVRYIESGGYTKTQTMHGDSEIPHIINNMQQAIKTEDVQQRVWLRMKQKEDFQEFISFLNTHAITIDILENTYTPAECTSMYVSWKKKEPIDF